MERDIILIVHNLRSSHNIGSLLRTADGLGVSKVYLSGYSPYPEAPNDTRLPHISRKLTAQIHKTALGAEHSTSWEHRENIKQLIQKLKGRRFAICALEQTDKSITLANYHPPKKIALIVGREVEGLEPEVINQADTTLEIQMLGHKESFNVVQAAAMALYHCRFMN